LNEEEIQSKLEEIKRKRESRKNAARRAGDRPSDEERQSENVRGRRGEPLTEEEIERRMREWRNSADPTCEACGACSDGEEENKEGD